LVLPAANKDLPLQIDLFLPFFFPIEMYGIYLSGISSISSSILSTILEVSHEGIIVVDLLQQELL
jgi:hypothetical protein